MRFPSLSVLVLLIAACGPKPAEKTPAPATSSAAGSAAADAETPAGAPAATGAGPFYFEDVTEQVGISFSHADGRNGKRYYVETSASAGGFFDYDGDGDLDLYLLNGRRPPESAGGDPPLRNAMYENRNGSFVDVTMASGTGDVGYGQGMCVGDYDGDGHLDLFVTNYGHNALYRNKGDGTFEEVSERAGLHEVAFSTGCAFGDVDGDGDLDLYVTNNVAWSYDNNKQCGFGTQHIKSYCRPAVFQGQTDHLYINQGNGRFREEGGARGLNQGLDDRGFTVIMSDMDNDGDPDIVVANDGSANRLYQNDGNGYFEDISEISGIAYNGDGESEAGMGMAVGDYDGDRLMDQLITNYSLETNTLYHNRGGMFFEDLTNRAGLGSPTYNAVGWGAEFLDFDNDGFLDLAVANGHLMDNITQINSSLTYHQPNQLFKGNGQTFEEVTQAAGPGFSKPDITRGLAVADLDDDGRPDVLFTNTNNRPNLLMNRYATGNHWVGLRLRGVAPNIHAIGARVSLFRGDTYLGMREVRSGGSFLSQSDLRPLFGLGKDGSEVRAEIRWPDGKTTTHTLTADRYHPVAR